MASDELGALLTELKQRSGRSYEWLARKTHTSKSTVQRHCTGVIVPTEFGSIERIARACGADADETTRLFQLWTQAVTAPAVPAPPGPTAPPVAAPEPAPEPEPEPTPEPEPEPTPEPEPEPTPVPPAVPRQVTPASTAPPPAARPGGGSSPAPGPGPGRYLLPLGVAASMVVVVLAVVAGVRWWPRSTPPAPTPDALANADAGWSAAERPVSPQFFGVTLNSNSGAMPTFQVGAVRLWDSSTRWAQLEPEPGGYDWHTLDRQVDGARRAGLPVLFVFGGTPPWANPGAPKGTYPDGGRTGPPLDLRVWDRFVQAVVTRYGSHIDGYEIWPLGNDRRYFSGSVEVLAEMTRRAERIIHAALPKATVVCPGMGNLWTAEGQEWLSRFADVGGYNACDVANVKLYQRSAQDPPETMVALADQIDQVLHRAGVHPMVWNTGTTYTIPLQGTLDPATARRYAVRFFLVGLYAHRLNVARMYFYNWGGTQIPIVLQPAGGIPTPAALAVEQLQRWLAHARISGCGRGLDAGLPVNVWECRFTLDEAGRGVPAVIRWAPTGTASIPAGPADRSVRRLDGQVVPLRQGDTIPLDGEPVLIERTPE